MTHQSSKLNDEDKSYNDAVILLDGLYEFHSDAFKALHPSELASLQAYYLTGKPVPENIFEHARRMRSSNADTVRQAEAAFRVLCNKLGIKGVGVS